MDAGGIGALIFREILGMSQYPGSPFSGQIINDLVMFLFIPTVFIIVVVYTLVGRLTDSTRIKLLLSITFYLFIIFGGYYSMFALLAGPYFLFLLIIMGIVFFFFGHFGLRRGGGGGKSESMPGRALMAGGAVAESHAQAAANLLNAIEVQAGVVDSSRKSGDPRLVPEQLRELGRLMTEFRSMKANMKFSPGERARYITILSMHGANERAIIDRAEHELHMKK